jgi:hypothetical protein
MTEVGSLGVTPPKVTRKDVDRFCANLLRSLRKAVDEGVPVCLDVKHDHEDMVGDSGMVLDVAWMGCKYTIWVGRPASKELGRRHCEGQR